MTSFLLWAVMAMFPVSAPAPAAEVGCGTCACCG